MFEDYHKMLKSVFWVIYSTYLGEFVSHPLLLWLLGEYWFCLSRYVYERNRPLRAYTKTKSVQSDVLCLLTCIDDDGDSRTMVQ
jgi:hypothetical protein